MSAVLPATIALRLPRWLPLAFVLLLAFGLRMRGLEQNGWGATYYTAAVRSMTQGWHSFFYLSFDPAGFASLDKPPVAVWLQVASVLLFGFKPFAVMLPQVLAGVAGVAIVFYLVRTRFGETAGLLAALALAVTPVWVAVNRTNNVDSCLLLVLLLAAWAMLRAIEGGSRRALFGAMALVGLAFNVKMLAGYVVLPVFYGGYLLAAPLAWRRRVVDLALATLVLLATSLPWVLAYELTPADARPWIGSTPHNTMRELVLGHNGVARFTSAREAVPADPDLTGARTPVPVATRLFVRAPVGPLRLAQGLFPVQFAWLLPLALAALALAVVERCWRRGWTAANVSLAFWTGWLAIYAIVYSALGGVMHLYYTNTMAPALAVLAAVGFVRLQGLRRRWVLPAVVALTLAWQVAIHDGALAAGQDFELSLWLKAAAGVLAAVSFVLLVLRRAERVAVVAAFAAVLVLPLLWTASVVLRPAAGLTPSADVYRLNPALPAVDQRALQAFGRMPDITRLHRFLFDHQGDAHYLVAATTTQLVAPIIIRTRDKAIAMGGIHGLDPAMSIERLQALVDDGELRYVLLGDATLISRRMGSEAAQRDVAQWVREHGREVPPELWRDAGPSMARAQLYDLRPG